MDNRFNKIHEQVDDQKEEKKGKENQMNPKTRKRRQVRTISNKPNSTYLSHETRVIVIGLLKLRLAIGELLCIE
jgi:hypothetical protein